MKTLLVISVFYLNYVTAHEKYAVKTFPKKVKPFGAGKILINPAKYMFKTTSPNPLKTSSDKNNQYTVFQVIGNSKTNRGVPDSPYFSVDQTIDHKPRVKKILPDYVWSALGRVKRSAPEAPEAEIEASKAESEVPKAESEAPIVASEALVVASKAPIVASEAPKAKSEAPNPESIAPKVESIVPKAESEAPKVESTPEPKSKGKTETSTTNKPPEKKEVQTISQEPETKQDLVLRARDGVASKDPKKRNLPTTKRVEKLKTKLKAVSTVVSKIETKINKVDLKHATRAKPIAKSAAVSKISNKIKTKVNKEDLKRVTRASLKAESTVAPKISNKIKTKLNKEDLKHVTRAKLRAESTAAPKISNKIKTKLNKVDLKRVTRAKLKAESTAVAQISNETETELNNENLKRVTRAAKKKKPIKKRNNTARSSKTNGTRSKKKLKRKSKSKNGKKTKSKNGRRRKSKSKKKKSKKSKKDSKRSKSKKSSRKGKRRTHRETNSTDINILKETRRLTAAKEALIEDYPYVVSIQKDGEHWCSGALVNPRMVITTANCLWKAERISRMEVRCGSSYTDQGGQVAEISEVMKHPRWGLRNTPDNDVALILLDRNIKFSHSVHAVDLPNRVMYPAFDDAWVTSFGSERRDGIFEEHETNLQVYHTHLMSNETCNNITTRFGVSVTENFICFSQTGKTSPCTRDTGAPAVSDGVLWGLASWSIRKLCGTERFPSMFSYLASHSNMDFITEATRQLMSEKRVYPFLDRSFAPKLRNFPTTQTPIVA